MVKEISQRCWIRWVQIFSNCLGGISIARSRRQIQEFYTDDINKFGDFPDKLPPENCHPPTDLSGALSYKALADLIGDFALSIYRPSSYVVSEKAKQRLAEEKKRLRFNQVDREKFLIGMMQTNFLKRLESSAHSLSETLGRTVGKIDRMLEKIDKFEQNRNIPDAHADALPDDDEDDEEFLINRAKSPYHLSELNCKRWKKDLLKDKETLTAAWDKVKSITPKEDGKLKEIKQHIREKVKNPNRKLLVFTTFKDTADYLFTNLSELAKELGLEMAMVSGDLTRTTCGQK